MSINQTFEKVKIILTANEPELNSEGWYDGDVISAEQEYINNQPKNTVWFVSKRNAHNCAA